MVEDFDGLAFGNGLREFLQGHVGTVPGAVDGKEAKAGRGQPIQVAVGMGHQLVGLFGGSVEAERVVYVVVYGERHGRIGAIHAGAAGVDQVFHAIVAATFEDMTKANEVAVDVGERVLKGVAHAGLGGQVDHALGFMGLKQLSHAGAVGHVHADMGVVGVIGLAG